MTLLASFEQDYIVNWPEMDQTHREFVALLNQLNAAPKDTFMTLFPTLLSHTKAHFNIEERWMQDSQFPASREHIDDHQRILGDLNRFAPRVAAGNTAMGRAYLREQLPSWFDQHLKMMDSALAAHLKAQ